MRHALPLHPTLQAPFQPCPTFPSWTSQEAAIIAVQLAVSRQGLVLTPFQQLLNVLGGTTLQAAAMIVIPEKSLLFSFC